MTAQVVLQSPGVLGMHDLHAPRRDVLELLSGRFASEGVQVVTWPPAMSRAIPVIHDDASEARNRAGWGASVGTPSRRSGYIAAIWRCVSAGMACSMCSLRTVDGERQLTRTP